MEIWLETSNIGAVQKAHQLGVLHGVVTNPTIAAHSGLSLEDLLQKLLGAQDGPVAAQVVSAKADTMIQQGVALASYSSRMIVKVPVTREGLQAIHVLSQKKIPVIATSIFELKQALLAARSGASYVSPYFSPICEADQDGIEVMRFMVRLLADYGYPVKTLASRLKSTHHAQECCTLGLSAVALNEDLFEEYVQDHPMTVKTQKTYERDWETAAKSKLY